LEKQRSNHTHLRRATTKRESRRQQPTRASQSLRQVEHASRGGVRIHSPRALCAIASRLHDASLPARARVRDADTCSARLAVRRGRPRLRERSGTERESALPDPFLTRRSSSDTRSVCHSCEAETSAGFGSRKAKTRLQIAKSHRPGPRRLYPPRPDLGLDEELQDRDRLPS
jgi:hypothetical protein